MPNKKSSDIVLGCLAALIICAGLAGSYYFYRDNQQTRTAIELKQQEIKAIENKIRQYPSLLIKLDQLEAEEAQLVSFIPSQEQQKEFIWELEALAAQSGVAIVQCEIAKDIKKLANLPQYQVYQWKLTLRGNYAGLTRFLDNLPTRKRAAVVSDLKVSAQPPQEDEPNNKQYRLIADMTLDLLSKPAGEKVAE